MTARSPSEPVRATLVVEALAGVAGVAALMTVTGGALLWLRFDRLDLPADRAVTLVPPEMIVTVGAHALLVAALAGVIAVIAIYALDDRSEIVLGCATGSACAAVALAIWDRLSPLSVSNEAILPCSVAAVAGTVAGLYVYALSRRNGRGRLPDGIGADDRPMVVALGVAGAGVVGLLSQLDRLRVFPSLCFVVLAVAAGLVVIYRGTQTDRGRSRKRALWTVFGVYLAVGTAVALVRTAAEPKLEPIAVLLEHPDQEIAGFYVGESGDEIHIARLPRGTGPAAVSAEPVDAVVSVARKRVTRKALRAPAGLGEAADGREQAETLLADLIADRRAPTAGAPPAEPVPTQAPERTFAPLVSLHSSEPIAPASTDHFLRNSQLHWAFRECSADQEPIARTLATRAQWRDLGTGGFRQAARCGDGDEYATSDYTRPYGKHRTFEGRADLAGREGFYLDLDDALRTPELKTGMKDGQRVLEPTPVYFERHDEVGEAGLSNVRITYWFFYTFSSPTGKTDRTGLATGHEGDWERISVLTHRTGDDLWLPLSVRFHEHDTSVDVPWERVRKAPDEAGVTTHPRAYVAKGSHATYRRPGRFSQILRRGGVEILAVRDEAQACPRCPLWYTWKLLVDATRQPWYGFGGAWGVVGSASDFTGPLGPSIGKTLQGRSPSPETALQPAPPVKVLPPP